MRPRVRTCIFPLTVLLLGLLIPFSASALEKTAVRVGDLERPDGWSAATTCQVVYYNFCTGWLWVWSGWSPYEVVGVCYGTCCSGPWPSGSVQSTWENVWTGAPCGRGFTGTIDIWSVDEDCCPVSHLASQPYYFHSGWNGHNWALGVVPPVFLVTVTFGPGNGTPATFASDHPAAGPTGPAACGYCFQLNRVTHSYDFGTSSAILCPGEKLNDGICDVEWYWDVAMSCEVPVETSSWARMKSLYR